MGKGKALSTGPHIWKKQDTLLTKESGQVLLGELVKAKSKGVLSHIRRRLTFEAIILLLGVLLFDGLFFLVDLPFVPLRWIGFGLFNLGAGYYGYCYGKVLLKTAYLFHLPVDRSLSRIISSLQAFQRQLTAMPLPVGLLVIFMFSLAQSLLSWLPWLLMEYLLWRWVLGKNLKSRFDTYLFQLEDNQQNLVQLKS